MIECFDDHLELLSLHRTSYISEKNQVMFHSFTSLRKQIENNYRISISYLNSDETSYKFNMLCSTNKYHALTIEYARMKQNR